ncbi:MAG: class I SAM-dependent methyltransferase [Myxococcota bacterium]
MRTLLYDELVPFYHLLDPLEDHADEGAEFGDVLRRAAPGARSLLELGAGAGHGAHYVKESFERVMLTAVSEPMLARSRVLNPDCAHALGDMRALRLAETFDAVLIHDAITYLTTEEELAATARTVAAHLAPEGAALLVPDCLEESFVESHEDHAGDDATRSLRCLSWSHDPVPGDGTHLTEFAFLLRENGAVRPVHDRHVHGLFAAEAWHRALCAGGLRAEEIRRPLPPEYRGGPYTEVMFLCRRA